MEMKPYVHSVQYYETDKMGITHHSNYIRWMEEARVDFLEKIGWGFDKMESEGVSSPVLEARCKYLKSTTFADKVSILARPRHVKGLKLYIEYEMRGESGALVATGFTGHCFLGKNGAPIRIETELPDFYNALEALAVDGKE